MDFAFVRTTELEQPLQLGAIGSLRALALFLEALEDFEALPLAVVFAGFQLRGKAQILGLAWIRNTDINYSSDHVSQLRPVLASRQDHSSTHSLRLIGNTRQVDLDQ